MKRDDFSTSRRDFLKKTGMASAAILSISALSSIIPEGNGKLGAWLGATEAEAAHVKKDIKSRLQDFFGTRKIEMSHVTMKAPIIAENGAVVPIGIDADLPMKKDNFVKKIYIFADNNGDPYITSTELTPANGKAALSMRIKMRKTSIVRVVVETNKGQLYGTNKTVKVTIGGCGG